MSHALDKAVTWRSIGRVGIAAAAEASLLTLIEDAPTALKVGTLLCATAGFAVFELEDWLRGRWKHLFVGAAVLIAAIWVGFVIYALLEVRAREATRDGLKAIYAQATPLVSDQEVHIIRKTDSSGNVISASLDPKDVTKFQRDFKAWETSSATWIQARLGETAADQFLDRANFTGLAGWQDEIVDQAYDQTRDDLECERKNLLAIMGNPIYDN